MEGSTPTLDTESVAQALNEAKLRLDKAPSRLDPCENKGAARSSELRGITLPAHVARPPSAESQAISRRTNAGQSTTYASHRETYD